MKYSCVIIIFITHLFSVQLVEPNPEGRTSIFIYHSGKALVHENRIVEFSNKGNVELKIVGISDQIIDAGIQLSANNYTLRNFSVMSDFVTEEALLKHFIGSRIMLKDFEKDKSIDATLISYNNYKAVYGVDNGVVVNPQLKPIFPYIPEHLENEVYIKTSGMAEMGNSILKLSYFTDGMNWNAEYHLVINEEDKATLSGDYQLINNTDKSFPPAEIFLVASNPINIHSIQKRSKMMAKSLEANTVLESPIAIEIDDVEIYKVPQKINLNQNSNLNAQFINSVQLSLEKLYIVNHSTTFRGRGGRRQNDDNWNSTKLFIKLNSSERLNIHLPKGRLNVYEKKDGVDMFIAEKSINKTSKGNDIQFHLKSSQDILNRFTTLEYNETDKGFFVTIEAKFRNLKNKNVSVIWKENSGRVIEIIDSSIDFEMDNAFEISAHVEIEAGATRKETITLFTAKRD